MGRFTVEGCVNLGNYESLRIGYEGGDGESAASVFEQLDGALEACQQRSPDEATRDTFSRYRKRALGMPTEKPAAETPAASVRQPPVEPALQEAIRNGTDPYPQAPPRPAKPPAAQGEEVCVGCGATVPTAQAKLSRLFLNKTLCKECLDNSKVQPGARA